MPYCLCLILTLHSYINTYIHTYIHTLGKAHQRQGGSGEVPAGVWSQGNRSASSCVLRKPRWYVCMYVCMYVFIYLFMYCTLNLYVCISTLRCDEQYCISLFATFCTVCYGACADVCTYIRLSLCVYMWMYLRIYTIYMYL